MSIEIRATVLSFALGASACATLPPPTDAIWPPEDTTTGIEHPELRAAVDEMWSFTLRESPLWATQLGIHRFDDRVDDPSHYAVLKRRSVRDNIVSRVERITGLTPADALHRDILLSWLRGEAGSNTCDFHLWNLSPRSNPITDWNYLPELHRVETEQDARHLLSRYRQIARSIELEIENLRLGKAQGLIANRRTLELVLEVVTKQLDKGENDWPLLDPVRREHPSFSPEFLAEYRTGLEEEVRKRVRPAFEAYAKVLKDELIPDARDEAHVGLSALPQGVGCYAGQIRRFLGVERSPEDLHAMGLAEIARIDQELTRLGSQVLGTTSLASTLERLRTDKSLYFGSSEEVENKAKSALDRARAKVPEAFGRLPKTDCVVTRIPDYEAPFTTVAYYRPPVPDGSKPGEYFINVWAPTTRTRYEAEALAYHESIPGHHLQIALAQEQAALPAFRKHYGLDVFVEGWGLYSERLADELGLYSAPLDRIGMYSFEAWRAARLVVDTGIHAKGWTRAMAIEFMMAHTALAQNNIENEVERYIAWPGQALAYKVGQLEILKLRDQAGRRLGSAFDLREFHDLILSSGAVPLEVLSNRIHTWLDRKAPATP